MILFIGGAYQGKREYMKTITGLCDAQIACGNTDAEGFAAIDQYHEVIRRQLAEGVDPVKALEQLVQERPDVVLVCDEVGMGIVPMQKTDRDYREAVGRTMCVAAERAEAVYRVFCGIGQRIK